MITEVQGSYQKNNHHDPAAVLVDLCQWHFSTKQLERTWICNMRWQIGGFSDTHRKNLVIFLIKIVVKISKALWSKQFDNSTEKVAPSAYCRLNLEMTSHLSQLLVMVQRIAASWLMITCGNLYSRFRFLKQEPRHLVGILPSLRQGFTLKGQMEDDMLVGDQGRTDLGNTSGLLGSERELCV